MLTEWLDWQQFQLHAMMSPKCTCTPILSSVMNSDVIAHINAYTAATYTKRLNAISCV